MEHFNYNFFSAVLMAIALFAVMPSALAFGAKESAKLFAFVFGLFAPGLIFIILALTVNLFSILAFRRVVGVEDANLWFMVYLYIVLGVYLYFPKIEHWGQRIPTYH